MCGRGRGEARRPLMRNRVLGGVTRIWGQGPPDLNPGGALTPPKLPLNLPSSARERGWEHCLILVLTSDPGLHPSAGSKSQKGEKGGADLEGPPLHSHSS